ncbi:MAG: hypothetical protein IH851_03110 [Armatimonadetes bacterium]|nr:hypothetical protein [Armatimonadota bacterium]
MNSDARQRGGLRLNPIVAFGVLGLLVAVALMILTFRGDTPEAAAEAFMQALAAKDVDALVELSYLEEPIAPLDEQWDFCVNDAGKNHVFMWEWIGSLRWLGEDRAAVKVIMMEFRVAFPNPVLGTQPEPDGVEIPLVLHEGKWKVDLGSLTRRLFPALPR